ncbi:hypothetical protein GF373_03645, partial [bacterium]|nr:hypothetical protein [bacterium]
VVTIPMYAPESDFTTQISMRDCQAFIDANPGALPEPQFITFRDELTTLAELMVKFVRSQVRKIGLSPKDCKELPLICGCHGTVIRPPAGIRDTGYKDTFELYQRLEASLKGEFADVRIGWLNHRLGGDWTTPTAEQSAKNLLEQGYKTWIYFPFGFLADNAESLLEGRVVFRDLGVESYHHLPCINEDPDFLRFIAQIIINRLN